MVGMKFPYKQLPANPSVAFPKRTKIYRPIIPVTIEYNGKKVGYEALIDSGSDWDIFPEALGGIIGIDVQKGAIDKFGGIGGGQFTAYFHDITLYIGGWPMKVWCGFSPDIPPKVAHGILGQVGFFNNFIVKFEMNKLEVEIKKI